MYQIPIPPPKNPNQKEMLFILTCVGFFYVVQKIRYK